MPIRISTILHFVKTDLKNPSGYIVICVLAVLGVALFGVDLWT